MNRHTVGNKSICALCMRLMNNCWCTKKDWLRSLGTGPVVVFLMQRSVAPHRHPSALYSVTDAQSHSPSSSSLMGLHSAWWCQPLESSQMDALPLVNDHHCRPTQCPSGRGRGNFWDHTDPTYDIPNSFLSLVWDRIFTYPKSVYKDAPWSSVQRASNPSHHACTSFLEGQSGLVALPIAQPANACR